MTGEILKNCPTRSDVTIINYCTNSSINLKDTIHKNMLLNEYTSILTKNISKISYFILVAKKVQVL